jgi:hypothetical protein
MFPGTCTALFVPVITELLSRVCVFYCLIAHKFSVHWIGIVCLSFPLPFLSPVRRVHFFGTVENRDRASSFLSVSFPLLPSPDPTLYPATQPVLRRFAPASSCTLGDLLLTASRQFKRRPHRSTPPRPCSWPPPHQSMAIVELALSVLLLVEARRCPLLGDSEACSSPP